MVNIVAFLFLSLIFSSLFCIGLWISSRGKHKINEVGEKEYEDDMIFYWLNELLMEEVTIKQNLTKEKYKETDKLAKEIDFTLVSEIINPIGNEYILLFKNWEDLYAYDSALAKIFQGSKIVRSIDMETNTIKLYHETKKYKYSKYIRKPIIGCYKCFASFWGIPLFIINYSIANKYYDINISNFMFVYLLIIHTFSLVVFNVWLNKKTS